MELLQEGMFGALTPEQFYASAKVVGQVHRLGRLVEQIEVLLAAKAGAGLLRPFDLGKVVQESVESYREAVRRADLTLEVVADAETFVCGDPYHIRHAIDALVENAVKFTPAGGRVVVRAFADSPWSLVEVSDTGIGIPDEEIGRIFSGFYQVDRSTTRRYGGIGLGLTLVQAVADEHMGHVSVRSGRERGSQFLLRFPDPSFSHRVALPMGRALMTRRILLVDDDASVAMILKEGLEMLPGCVVSVATSGEEALRMLGEQPFDLLITDYKMPEMDGLALTSRVRDEYPSIAVVMITAYADDLLFEQAARLSIQAVLDKPVRMEEIRRAVLRVLGGLYDRRMYGPVQPEV